jgi:hypothetical protein
VKWPDFDSYGRKVCRASPLVSNEFDTMEILRFVSLSIAGLIGGATAGCIGGLALGWWLALSYHRHGPADPGDAPVYVTMGLMAVGACLGAITGFIIALVYNVRLARSRKHTDGLQKINE